MAKREVGYVELIWTCPTCGARNPGPQTTCAGCGAPQPDDVKFELPAGADLIEDAAKIAQAKAGPDIHCGYCGARNRADAKVCRQCGADLSAGAARPTGAVVGAPGEVPVAEVVCPNCGTANTSADAVCRACGTRLRATAPPAATPQPPPSVPARSGPNWMLLAFIAIAAVTIGAAVFGLARGMRTNDVAGTVADTRWVRRVMIEAPVPVQREAWRDQIPYGAAVGACTRDVRSYSPVPVAGAQEVCGTPYVVDTGTGFGRMEQDCEYAVLDQRCAYTSTEWRVIDTLVTEGSGFDLRWPAPSLGAQQRVSGQTEEFQCVFNVNGKRYVYTPRSVAEYELCRPGRDFDLTVNGFGDIVAVQPRN